MDFVKVNGVWRKVIGNYVKVGGAWREVTDAYVKVDNGWKQSYQNNFRKPSFLTYPTKITRGDTITWETEDIPGADYEVEAIYDNGEYNVIKFFSNPSGTFSISTNTTYSSVQLRVRAVAPTTHDKASGYTYGSTRGLNSQTLPAPDGLSYPSTITRGQKIKVSWTSSSLNTYEVQAMYVRADGTTSPDQFFRGKGSSADYTVQTNTAWKKVYFRIRAIRTGYFTSDYAYGDERTLQKMQLGTVPSLSAPIPSYEQKITVSWGAVTNAEKYVLERRYNDGSWGDMYTGTNRTFTYTTTDKREHLTITWRVKAIADDYLDSDWKTGPDQKITPPVLKTTTWKATDTASWRSREDWGWREDNDRVYQGSWNEPPWWGNHIGCVWFDFNSMRRTLAGKDIERVRIYFYRMNTQHGYASGQAIKLHTHNHASKPPGETRPTISYVQGPFASFDRGEGKWVTVSNKVAERIRDGSACGIALYREDEQGYLYMSTNIQIEVTYR